MVNPVQALIKGPSTPAAAGPAKTMMPAGGMNSQAFQQAVMARVPTKKKTIEGGRGLGDRIVSALYDHPTSPGNKATSSFFAKY